MPYPDEDPIEGPVEIEFNDKAIVESIKGKGKAKDFNKQMKELKEMFPNGL